MPAVNLYQSLRNHCENKSYGSQTSVGFASCLPISCITFNECVCVCARACVRGAMSMQLLTSVVAEGPNDSAYRYGYLC